MNVTNTQYVEIYTDGACSGNPGPGGWGALLIYKDHKKEIFGSSLDTTNNQMEMMAAIEALKLLKTKCKVHLHTDSKYLQKGITEWIYKWQMNGWQTSAKKPVKNLELWQALFDLIQKHDIIWSWVKGHANNEGNEIADQLAVKGRDMAMNASQRVRNLYIPT